MLESVKTSVNVGSITTSVSLSVTGVGLKVVPLSAGIPCDLSLDNNVLHQIKLHKFNNYKKQK